MRRPIFCMVWAALVFATFAGASDRVRTSPIRFQADPVGVAPGADLAHSSARTAAIPFAAAPYPPRLQATVRFEEPSGNRALDALEEGALVVTLHNSGRGDAYDVSARVTLQGEAAAVKTPPATKVGTVAAGQQREIRLPLRAAKQVADRTLKVQLTFPEANGFDADPVLVALDTRSFAPPQLEVADYGIDDASGNGQVEPGEFVEVTVRVKNVGRGDAADVVAAVDLGDNIYHGAGSSREHRIGNLLPNQHSDFHFSFYTNKRIRPGQALPITVHLREGRGHFETADNLPLVANAPQRRSQEVVVESLRVDPAGEATGVESLSIDVDRHVPTGKTRNPHAVAVVIGNRHYRKGKVPAVQFAHRDATMVQTYLEKVLGYERRNIIAVSDATLSDFNQLFGTHRNPQGRLHDYVRPGRSDVFVYYTGHGAPDPGDQSAYFVPSDADPDYIGSSGYPLDLFWENLARIPARNITVVLDTCFSGNSEKGLLLSNVSPALLKVRAELAGPAGAVVMTSAATDQVSNWYPEKKHSLFTYWWLKGIGGAADADRDQAITVGELEAYLGEHVPYWAQRLSHRKQTPVVRGDAERVLVELQ